MRRRAYDPLPKVRLAPSELVEHFSDARTQKRALAMCAALALDEDDWPDIARGIGSVYFIFSPKLDAIKIGFSFYPDKRVRHLQTGSADRHVLLGTVRGPVSLERDLHKKFKMLRISGEWFNANKRLRDYIAEVAAK